MEVIFNYMSIMGIALCGWILIFIMATVISNAMEKVIKMIGNLIKKLIAKSKGTEKVEEIN